MHSKRQRDTGDCPLFSVVFIFNFPLPLLSAMIAFFSFLEKGQWRVSLLSPAYVKTWKGTMVTKPSKPREDVLTVMDGHDEEPVYQTKNKWLWRLTRSKTLITLWVAIRGSSRQRKQRKAHGVMLHSGIIIWIIWSECSWLLLQIFGVYSGQDE